MARGGSRPGAGRPKGTVATPKKIKAVKKSIEAAAPQSRRFATALDFLMDVVNDEGADKRERVQAAQVAIPYTNAKLAEVAPGKKEQAQERAKEAASKFAAPTPPKLVVDNR